jgi:hypothetical protein
MLSGCSRCGRSDAGMNITLFKSKPYCDECFAIECPPANVMCSFRCGNTVSDPTELTKRQPLCPDCRIKLAADVVKVSMDMQPKTVDSTVNIKTDVFNAATQSIIALKAEIDADPSIENKAYILAERLRSKFDHWRGVVFEYNEKLAEAGTEQRAIQVYLNNMANTLRASEREKLRIADINYKPQPVSPAKVKTIKVPAAGLSSKKATNKEIAEAAKLLGIAEFTLKAFVHRFGGDLGKAVDKIKLSLAAAKAAD